MKSVAGGLGFEPRLTGFQNWPHSQTMQTWNTERNDLALQRCDVLPKKVDDGAVTHKTI
jgi:hypothetical protein